MKHDPRSTTVILATGDALGAASGRATASFVFTADNVWLCRSASKGLEFLLGWTFAREFCGLDEKMKDAGLEWEWIKAPVSTPCCALEKAKHDAIAEADQRNLDELRERL